MSTAEARQNLARAIRDQARSQAERATQIVRGEVTGVHPLRIELFGSDITLRGDEIDWSQWVRLYDALFKISKGDAAVLARDGGDWTFLDVMSDKEMRVSAPDNSGPERVTVDHGPPSESVHTRLYLDNDTGDLYDSGLQFYLDEDTLELYRYEP